MAKMDQIIWSSYLISGNDLSFVGINYWSGLVFVFERDETLSGHGSGIFRSNRPVHMQRYYPLRVFSHHDHLYCRHWSTNERR